MNRSASTVRRPLAVAVISSALALGATACGGGNPATAVPGSSAASSGAEPGFNGTFGTVASLAGSTMEVQNATSQTTVTFTASTVFTRTATVSLADIAVGSCIVVTGAPAISATTITATAVQVSKPIAGGCRTGVRRGGPSGVPSGVTSSGSARGFGGSGRGGGGVGGRGATAIGSVTSMTGSVLVVAGTEVTRTVGIGSPIRRTGTVTVTIGSGVPITETVSATAGNLAVGVCVAAIGSTASNGNVTARTIAISQPVSGTCRFGGFRGRRGGTGG